MNETPLYALRMQLEPEAYTQNAQTAVENPLKLMLMVFGIGLR